MMKKFAMLGAVFAAALGIGIYLNSTPNSSSGSSVGPSLGAAQAQTATTEVDTSLVEEMVMGADDAPITIVEYASYTCPHCRRFHEGAYNQLKSEYIDAGNVKFIYREVYFDRFGLWASIIARCGGQEKFFGITDLIYTQQSTWTQGDPATIAGNLRRIGLTAGLTEPEVDACFTDGENAQRLVQWYEENREADDISSTPTFLINGKKYANMSIDEFRTILDGLL